MQFVAELDGKAVVVLEGARFRADHALVKARPELSILASLRRLDRHDRWVHSTQGQQVRREASLLAHLSHSPSLRALGTGGRGS
jgi:hypothetical protein